ncbi:MAG: iron ABC transporter permease [Deltaproteobacteria bacterium]|nr:iron ABC transporter permease [Deltaproteobacteria bacterium]
MNVRFHPLPRKLITITLFFGTLLMIAAFLGVSMGSSGSDLSGTLAILAGYGDQNSIAATIIRRIRIPRVILAAAVGSTLSLGGLVFQALLRNPLAEPYILGISGGSAIGAIGGLLAGLSPFPGVPLAAFTGSMAVLGLILLLVMGRPRQSRDALLLGGVMMNAFCAAVILFLISITRSEQVQQILFWLMGDLSRVSTRQLPVLFPILLCFLVIFLLARPMNLLVMGKESALSMGVNVKTVTLVLLVLTSLMVSLVVCQSGLVGFVGLVIPHLLRLVLGPDHRLLIPASILGGATYLILCDLLARILSVGGEMPVGIITAMIGAPLFVYLLWRANQ